MTTTVAAHYDGSSFIPDEPVEMPPGSKVTVQLLSSESTNNGKPLTGLARLAAMIKTLPADPDAHVDSAAQHDHYLYGTPKR